VSTFKACKDCKHSHVRGSNSEYRFCSEGLDTVVNPVTGKTVQRVGISCQANRYRLAHVGGSQQCGPDASKFAPASLTRRISQSLILLRYKVRAVFTIHIEVNQ